MRGGSRFFGHSFGVVAWRLDLPLYFPGAVCHCNVTFLASLLDQRRLLLAPVVFLVKVGVIQVQSVADVGIALHGGEVEVVLENRFVGFQNLGGRSAALYQLLQVGKAVAAVGQAVAEGDAVAQEVDLFTLQFHIDTSFNI